MHLDHIYNIWSGLHFPDDVRVVRINYLLKQDCMIYCAFPLDYHIMAHRVNTLDVDWNKAADAVFRAEKDGSKKWFMFETDNPGKKSKHDN